MNDYAHCRGCDLVIKMDKGRWTIFSDNTYCESCITIPPKRNIKLWEQARVEAQAFVLDLAKTGSTLGSSQADLIQDRQQEVIYEQLIKKGGK